MQPQFTEKARTALLLAEKTASALRQGYVGTEHILAGLLRERTGVAARVLLENGVEETQLLEMIKDLITPEKGVLAKDRDGYSPRAMKVLAEAHRQAERFESGRTGTLPALYPGGQRGQSHGRRPAAVLPCGDCL